MKPLQLAACLLVAWFLGHHAYKLAPVAIEGHAWNIGMALSKIVLIGLVADVVRHPVIHTILAWLFAEEFQAVGCTAAYIIEPWPMQPGQEKCSEALGLPLQTVCLVALLWTGAWLLDRLKGKP